MKQIPLEQKYQALLSIAQSRQMPDSNDIRLCFQALSLAAAIDRDCATQLAPHGLSEGRFIMLFLLESSTQGLAPNELATQAGITRATVTGLLDRLERDGLVERVPDAHDRRALRVELTAKGRQLAAQVFTQHGHWIAGLFKHLSPEERSQLSQLLNKAATGLPACNTAKETP